MYTRAQLENLLKTSVHTVTFKKKNGDTRVMRCTLLEDFIPKNKKPKGNKAKDNVLPVFDIEMNDWRSFDPQSVSDVK